MLGEFKWCETLGSRCSLSYCRWKSVWLLQLFTCTCLKTCYLLNMMCPLMLYSLRWQVKLSGAVFTIESSVFYTSWLELKYHNEAAVIDKVVSLWMWMCLIWDLMCPSLRTLTPPACGGRFVSGCHSIPSASPFSFCQAFLSAKHFLLCQGCHGDGHAHSGIDWATTLLFLQQHPWNAKPLWGMTGAHMEMQTYH